MGFVEFDEKKLFIRQADIYGAYLAYADHEIGRVVQAVDDLGELDNTLISYIGGDNGASAEGMVHGTPNEFTTINGVSVPVMDQFLWYPFWGSERTFPHYAAGWAWAMDTPFRWVKQVPSQGNLAGRRLVVARSYHRRRRRAPSVPPRDRTLISRHVYSRVCPFLHANSRRLVKD